MGQFRSVCLGIWVMSGARDETHTTNGISHFVEHLVFKGTEQYSALQISEHFDSLGAEINAFSSKEYTCYYVRVLDDYVEKAFEVLAEIVQRPAFRDSDIEAERQVVLEEISLYEDTPDDRIHDLVVSELWPQHPLGKRVLGFMDTVSGITRDQIAGYFAEHYSRSNIVIAAAGNIDHQHLVAMTKEYFSDSETGQPFSRNLTNPEVCKTSRFYFKETEQAHICLAMPALSAHDESRYSLAVMDSIVGSGMSSRLFQTIREREGLAYSVYSYANGYTETGLYAIYAGTRPNNAQRVLDICLNELDGLAKEGVTEAELTRSKNQLIGQMVISLESTNSRMSRLGKNELLGVEFVSVEEVINRIELVSIADVNGIFNRIYDPKRFVLAVIGPFEKDSLKIG